MPSTGQVEGRFAAERIEECNLQQPSQNYKTIANRESKGALKQSPSSRLSTNTGRRSLERSHTAGNVIDLRSLRGRNRSVESWTNAWLVSWLGKGVPGDPLDDRFRWTISGKVR
jgi:hypothetical protein